MDLPFPYPLTRSHHKFPSDWHLGCLASPNCWEQESERVAILPMPVPEQGMPHNQACVYQGVTPSVATGTSAPA